SLRSVSLQATKPHCLQIVLRMLKERTFLPHKPSRRPRPLAISPPMSTADESPAERRRARLRFRAQRRGFKEVDLIFGAFADSFLGELDETELDQFEA